MQFMETSPNSSTNKYMKPFMEFSQLGSQVVTPGELCPCSGLILLPVCLLRLILLTLDL
jgi:hypothetical protein